MVRVIYIRHSSTAGFKLTKLFGIYDFSVEKDSGKVFIIIIYCFYNYYYYYYLNPASDALFQRPKDGQSKKFNPAADKIWFCSAPLGTTTLDNMKREMQV